RWRHFQIGEHPRRPRLEMPLEKPRLFGELSLEVVACEACHHLEQDGDVILRLPRGSGALDSECIQILAQPRQRALVKEAGQIVGAIAEQIARAETDEKIEEHLSECPTMRKPRAAQCRSLAPAMQRHPLP